MSNIKPENQTAYYQEHPPKCIVDFLAQAARFDNVEFDGHGSSGIYPNGLDENLNTIFAIRCRCGSSIHRIVAESEYQEIWRYKNLVVAERYFVECKSCGSHLLLFDRYLHGYDAEDAKMEGLNPIDFIDTNQSLLKDEKVTCTCSSCENTTFEVFTRFEYPSDLFDEPLFEGREHEFFSWFTGIGRCSTCSTMNMFIDFECA